MADFSPYATVGTDLVSIYELLKSQQALKNLNAQPTPQFAATPELLASKGRADYLSNYGFSPAEQAGFRKNVAQDINTKTQNALNLGGGSLAKVIGGIGKIDESAAESKFATSDAALHRQNIHYSDKFANQVQDLSNKNISEQLRERLIAEQQLGTAEQTGLAGLGTGANYLGTTLGSPKNTTGGNSDLMAMISAYLKKQQGGAGVTSNAAFVNAGPDDTYGQ